MTTCPNCGSRHLRPAQPRKVSEWLAKLVLIDPLRCRDCKTRFVARTFRPEDLFYSRCPQCRRQDLNQWTGKTFTAPFWMSVKVSFGARKWRCEYCRLNFASFRPRKEIFSFSRWRKLEEERTACGRAEDDE